jgi:hypothetical protein
MSSWPVPPGHLDLLVERAAGEGTFAIPVLDPADRHRLVLAIAEAAVLQDNDAAYNLELSAWTGRSSGADDGVLSASTLARCDESGGVRMRKFSAGRLAPSPVGDQEDDAAELVVLATLADDPLSWLRAGEAASVALLTATELGLATCPLSQPLEIAGTRRAIRDGILDGLAVPQLVLRTGWAPASATPVPPSRRRQLDEVVANLAGAGTR